MENTFLENTLTELEAQGLKRHLRSLESPQKERVIIAGREVLNFCSNNYLGLACDPRLSGAAVSCINRQGFGSGASRLVCGNLSAHKILEEKIASFKQTESCLVFSTGYMANVGIISSLFGRDDVIFCDRLNHASIIDGIILSQAKFRRYPHCDMDALEDMLKASSGFKKKVIITDTVFSMDGNIAPLDKIALLAKRYGCMIMVDEAHALGVLGKNGKGAVEHFSLEGQIDIQMGTLSKAVGSFGAYVCGSYELIEYLINKARSFIYTTGMPPSVAAASLKGIEIIEQDKNLRERLWKNTEFVLVGLKELGFNTLNTQTPIIPIVVKEPKTAVEFSERLFDKGIWISAIRPPTVPKDTARLRLTLMATHEQNDLEYMLEQMERIGKELCLL